jgi:putative ABC transport system permease protein
MMKLLKYLVVAIDSVRANKLRAALTMLGIVIGVAAVLTTMGIGAGAAASITSDIESQGANLLTVNARGGGSSSTLTMSDAQALADATYYPDIELVGPEYTGNATLTNGDAESDSQVTGTTPEYAVIRNLTVESGRFLTAEDVASNQRVVVLGYTLAHDLFSAEPLAQSVRIDNEVFTVVGILEEKGGQGFGSNDERAFVPISVAQDRLFSASRYRGAYTITGISIRVADSERLDAAEQQVEQALRMRHRLGSDDDNDFTISNQASLLATVSSITQTLTIFLGSIGAISLLVGGIGIMNIMLVSVTERTKEIGLRKALGAHDSDILLQFVVEALVLCTLGGLIGIGLSYTIAYGVNLLPNFNFDLVISAQALLLALSVSMGCGLVFGLYPALRATQLNPIEALRYE